MDVRAPTDPLTGNVINQTEIHIYKTETLSIIKNEISLVLFFSHRFQ